ncbi:MAG: DUF4810 domain-containing protein [Burkholderiaceae bacterium]
MKMFSVRGSCHRSMSGPVALGLLLLVSGCATGLYEWGQYEQTLYQKYKDPGQSEAMRVNLTNHIALMEKSNLKVAPGLYAELGTLYLEAGDAKSAIRYYELEQAAWPESEALMTAMITNLKRMNKPSTQNKGKTE